MTVTLRSLTGDDLAAALPAIARLRTEVFRDWPYLYEGDADYEELYLAALAAARDAVIVGAFDGDVMVGAATACPLAEADAAFQKPFRDAGIDVGEWFYFGESVLEQPYRGRGIGVRFFREREAAARKRLFARCCFCAVARAPDDPRRRADYEPLDGFWNRRGYRPLGLTALYAWRDLGQERETAKAMRFWGRTLPTV